MKPKTGLLKKINKINKFLGRLIKKKKKKKKHVINIRDKMDTLF